MSSLETKKHFRKWFWLSCILLLLLIVYAVLCWKTYNDNSSSAENLNLLVQSNIMINNIKSEKVYITECLDKDISEINTCIELQTNLLIKQKKYIKEIKKDNPKESEIEKNIDISLISLDSSIDNLITKLNEIKLIQDGESISPESVEQLKKINRDLIHNSLVDYQDKFNKLVLITNQLFLKPELISPLKVPDFHQVLKDIITVGASLFTVFGVFIGGYATYQTWNKSLETRNDEVRSNKANAANKIYKRFDDDIYNSYAMRMLESYERNFLIPPSNEIKLISKERVIEALERVNLRRFKTSAQYEIDRFIYDCFDHFFSVMQEMEHKIKIGLIDPEDVTYPFTYYAPIMYGYADLFEGYLRFHFPPESLRFLKRFSPWKKLNLVELSEDNKTSNNIFESEEFNEAVGRAGLRRSKLLVIVDNREKTQDEDIENIIKVTAEKSLSSEDKSIKKSIKDICEILYLKNDKNIYQESNFSFMSNETTLPKDKKIHVILFHTSKADGLRKADIYETFDKVTEIKTESLKFLIEILNKDFELSGMEESKNRSSSLHPGLYVLPESFTDTLNNSNDFLNMMSDKGYVYIHKDRIKQWSNDPFHRKIYIEEISGEQYKILNADFEKAVLKVLNINVLNNPDFGKATINFLYFGEEIVEFYSKRNINLGDFGGMEKKILALKNKSSYIIQNEK